MNFETYRNHPVVQRAIDSFINDHYFFLKVEIEAYYVNGEDPTELKDEIIADAIENANRNDMHYLSEELMRGMWEDIMKEVKP